MRVSNKDAEIALLKVELLEEQIEGQGTSKVLKLPRQNEEPRGKISALKNSQIQ